MVSLVVNVEAVEDVEDVEMPQLLLCKTLDDDDVDRLRARP